MSIHKDLKSGDDGVTLVEAALSISLLLTMVFGIIAGGYMLYAYHYISYAARLGTRYAIVRGSACDNSGGMPDCPNVTNAQITAYVQGKRFLGIDPSLMTVTASWPNGTDNPGDPINVTVQYPFPFAVPFVTGNTVIMHSTSQMVISQ
jgi:Flp pilus assembly protein TadG